MLPPRLFVDRDSPILRDIMCQLVEPSQTLKIIGKVNGNKLCAINSQIVRQIVA